MTRATRGRPKNPTPTPPRRGDRHARASGDTLQDRRLLLSQLRDRAQVAWGDTLDWRALALLAGLAPSALRMAWQGRTLAPEALSSLQAVVVELEGAASALPEDIAVCKAQRWTSSPRLLVGERDAVEAAAKIVSRLSASQAATSDVG